MSQLKKNFFYNSILSITGLVAPLITFPYTSRVIGPEGIGLVNFVNSFVQYFLLVAALGIPIYGVRQIAKARGNVKEISKVFMEIIFIRFGTTILILVPYIFVIYTVGKCQENLHFFLWGICSIVLGAFEINWFFSGIEDFKFITIRSLIFQVIQVGCIFLFIRNRNDIFIYFILPIVIGAINILVNIRYALRFIKFDFSLRELMIKEHLKPMLYIFFSTLAISIYVLLDTVILGFLTNSKDVGYYTAATRINKMPLAFISVLAPVLIPRLSFAVERKDFNEINQLIQKSIKFVIMMAIPIMTGIFVLAPEIVSVLAGKEFEPAVTTIRIICPIVLMIGLSNIFGMQVLIPLGKDKLLLISVLVGTIFSIIFNFLFIPIWKFNGAAITNLLSEIAVTLITFFYAKKIITIYIPKKFLFLNIIFSLPFVLFAFFYRTLFQSNILIFLFTVFTSFLFFIIAQVFILKNAMILDLIQAFKNKFIYGQI